MNAQKAPTKKRPGSQSALDSDLYSWKNRTHSPAAWRADRTGQRGRGEGQRAESIWCRPNASYCRRHRILLALVGDQVRAIVGANLRSHTSRIATATRITSKAVTGLR